MSGDLRASYTLLLLLLLVFIARCDTLTIAQYGGNSSNETYIRVAVVCGLHPRERISAALCARWSDVLRRTAVNPYIAIMLVTVVHSGAAARTALGVGDPCWRGNEYGVDLNRDWTPVPGCYSEFLPHDDAAAAPEPFSERETAALGAALLDWAPDVLLAIHSGTRAVLTPYDSCDRTPANWPDMLRFARWLTTDACPDCTITASPRALDYWARGTLTDWAVFWLAVPLVLTLEIYEDRRAIYELQLSSLDHKVDSGEAALTPALCERLFSPADHVRMELALRPWDSALYRLALIRYDDFLELLVLANR
jgi:hypothetical protein